MKNKDHYLVENSSGFACICLYLPIVREVISKEMSIAIECCHNEKKTVREEQNVQEEPRRKETKAEQRKNAASQLLLHRSLDLLRLWGQRYSAAFIATHVFSPPSQDNETRIERQNLLV